MQKFIFGIPLHFSSLSSVKESGFTGSTFRVIFKAGVLSIYQISSYLTGNIPVIRLRLQALTLIRVT